MRKPCPFEIVAFIVICSYLISSWSRFYIIEMFITYPLMGVVFYLFPREILADNTPDSVYSILSAIQALLFVGIGYHWFADSAHNFLENAPSHIESYLFFHDEIMSHTIMLLSIFSYITVLSWAYIKWKKDFEFTKFYKILSFPAGIGFGMMIMDIDAYFIREAVFIYALLMLFILLKHRKAGCFIQIELLFFGGTVLVLGIFIFAKTVIYIN